MQLKVFPDKSALSQAAAEQAATAIRQAIADRGKARIVAATAASQIEFLDGLTRAPEIDWKRVEAFHAGLGPTFVSDEIRPAAPAPRLFLSQLMALNARLQVWNLRYRSRPGTKRRATP